MEQYITIGQSPLPKQFPSDKDEQASPEIILKTCGTDGEMYKRVFLVWSQVKQASCCFPYRMFWHTNGVVSSRIALASPLG